MKNYFFILCFLIAFSCIHGQTNALELNAANEKMYSPFMLARHGGGEGLAEFKKDHPHDYLKELWYYSKSFYIRRNVFTEGTSMDISHIDITRFEKNRKQDESADVIIAGYRDVLVLIPAKDLIYKP